MNQISFDQVWETFLDAETDVHTRRRISQANGGVQVTQSPRELLPEVWQETRDRIASQFTVRKETQRRTASILDQKHPEGILHDFFAGDGMATVPWATSGNTDTKKTNLVNYPDTPRTPNPTVQITKQLVKDLGIENRVEAHQVELIGDPNAMARFRKRGNVVLAHSGLLFPNWYRTPWDLGEDPDWVHIKRSLHITAPGNNTPPLEFILSRFAGLRKGTQIEMIDTPFYKKETDPSLPLNTEQYLSASAEKSGWKVVDMQLGTPSDPFYTCTLEK